MGSYNSSSHRETSCAGVTTVRSSDLTSTRRTTAATCLRTCPAPQLQSSCPGLPSPLPRDRDVGAGTSTGGGAALQSSPVGRERETVTVLETEESMMVTEDVGVIWCAGVTTVRSSELTTTRRMTAARDPATPTNRSYLTLEGDASKTGAPGQAGGVWLPGLSGGNRSAGVGSVVSAMAVLGVSTPRRGTPTLTVSEINLLKIFSIFIMVNSAENC